MENNNIVFKGFVVPRDDRHAEWLKMGQEIGEIKSPILDPLLAEQLAQAARVAAQLGSGILLVKVRDDGIEIEFKPISISPTATTNAAGSGGTAAASAGSGTRENKLEIIKVTRENRPIVLRQLAREGWQVFFRNTEVIIEDTGYVVDGRQFTTLNAAVKFILESTGKTTSQVNAWEAIRLIKGDRVAKLEL